MFSWNTVLQKMDYKSVVYNAARDGNLNRLKVSESLFISKSKGQCPLYHSILFFFEHWGDIYLKKMGVCYWQTCEEQRDKALFNWALN